MNVSPTIARTVRRAHSRPLKLGKSSGRQSSRCAGSIEPSGAGHRQARWLHRFRREDIGACWLYSWLPNGSRLSCGRLARRRKGVGRQSVPARAQHSASLRAITARQLQALVRQPRSCTMALRQSRECERTRTGTKRRRHRRQLQASDMMRGVLARPPHE